MFNFIITILLISNIFNIFKGRSKSSTLNCGIWGYIGKDVKDFQPDKFTILGIENDSRGGDAAGFVVDNSLYHKTDVKFSKLAGLYSIPKPKKYPIVLGHTRKATSGGNLIQFTQPFVLNDSKKIIGVGNHNGTLTNTNELIKKYNIPETVSYRNGSEIINYRPNDTQVLFYALLKNKDLSILSEYEGAAALIWYDRELDKTFVFKGASKKYQYGQVEEERSLFMYTNKSGIWVSSLEQPLWIISTENEPEIQDVGNNNLLTIENGKVTEIKSIDRPYKDTFKYWKNPNYGGRVHDYNDYYGEDYRYNVNDHLTVNQQKQLGFSNIPVDNTMLYEYITEKIDDKETTCVQFKSGRYYLGDKRISDILHLDELGYVRDKKETDTMPYYFIDGIMIKSRSDFQTATRLRKKIRKGQYIPAGSYPADNVDKKVIIGLLPYSVYPICSLTDKKRETYIWESGGKRWFTGDIEPLFSDTTYIFNIGDIKSITKTNSIRTADHSKQSSTNETNNTDNYDLSPEDNQWAEDAVKTALSSKFDEIWKIVNSIETDILINEDLAISKEAQKVIDSMKETLNTSALNII